MTDYKNAVPNNLPGSFSLPFEVALFFDVEKNNADENSDVVVEIYANSAEIAVLGLNFDDLLQNTIEVNKSQMSESEIRETVKTSLQKFIDRLGQLNDEHD